MIWWRWRRRNVPDNKEATKARAEAGRALEAARGRRREVEAAKDHFAQLIEQALRGTR